MRTLPLAALAVQRQLRALEEKHRAGATPSVYPNVMESRGHQALEALDRRALEGDRSAAEAAHVAAEQEAA